MAHRVLVADKSITIQRVAELTFSAEGMEVLAVGDGQRAIARILADHPDIVLADIGMPQHSGYDVAAFVKRHPDLKHIPVLLLAGAFEPVDDARAEQIGCDGVIIKPFEPQHVMMRVRELLDGKGSSATKTASNTLRPVEQWNAPRPLRRREQQSSSTSDQVHSHGIEDVHFEVNWTAEILDEVSPQLAMPEESPEDHRNRLEAVLSTLRATSSLAQPERWRNVTSVDNRLDVIFDDLFGQNAALGPGPAPESTALVSSLLPAVRPSAVEPPNVTAGRAATPSGSLGTASFEPSMITGTLAALAVGRREPSGASVGLTRSITGPATRDELVEELTYHLLERLKQARIGEVVAQVVSELVERIVREEIRRIRTHP